MDKQREKMDAVASPCIGVCHIDPETNWCVGCMRTLDEIAVWSKANAVEKRRILSLLPQRKSLRSDSQD